MAIKFNLEDNEANFILQVIGQLPTQSGAYPLLQKLEGQAKEQIKEVASKPAEETTASD
jgi:hypothetical protein